MGKIKFCSKQDMSIGYYAEMIKEYHSAFDYNKENYNINEMLEIYNIVKYFDNNLINKNFYDVDKFALILKKILGKYFNQIDIIEMLKNVKNINDDYSNDFFECIVKYKTYKKINDETMKSIIKTKKYFLQHALQNKQLVINYDNLFKEMLLNDVENAVLILDTYEILHDNNNKSLFMPASLTLIDKEKLILDYVNSENPNLNYLQLIVNIINSKDLHISNKTRLLTKKKCGKIENILLTNNSMKFGAEVIFAKGQKEVSSCELKDLIIKCVYSIEWLEKNLDYPTLLNNFIYLFEYVDKQMRCLLSSNKRERSLLSELKIHSKSEYQYGTAFIQRNQLANIQMMAYKNQLAKLNIRIEEIYEWFFSNYLKDEFLINDFYVSLPSIKTTPFEKCKLLIIELESILKQYNMYAEENIIDHELLEISSEKFLLEYCKSIIEKKYIYRSKNSDVARIMFLLFSDQCMLSFIEGKKEESNFYKLLMKNKTIKKDDIVEYEKVNLVWLISINIVEVNDKGYLQFKDITTVNILADLFYNNVISYWHYGEKTRNIINELINKGWFCFESSLFTKDEADYFSFNLNRSKFNNGYDLRNKYSHGTHSSLIKTDIHNSNYHIALKLLTIITIKINDELCLKESSQYKKYLKQKIK